MGRMVPIKGIELLAEVVNAASANNELMFLIAGDGPLRPRFENATRSCGNLRMLGWQEDIAPLVKASDVVLMTSINEGTPTALIEAMFAGRPFVATDAGGTSELALELEPAKAGIRQGKNGFIVDRNAETIATCLSDLARSPALREAMGRAGCRSRTAELEQRAASERNQAALLRTFRPLENPTAFGLGQATKYLAWGWWTTRAEVDCSGSSWKPLVRRTPMFSSGFSSAKIFT
jgi:Glycosyltransferase